MEMVVFVGCQGAGKTTFYAAHFFQSHIRISLDMLKTRHREKLLFRACIDMKQPFVIDNTNPTKADRAKYLDWVAESGFKVLGYYFESPVETLIARNAQRSGKAQVPEIAIRGTLKKLEKPSLDEGFDRLYRVRTQDNGMFLIEEYP